MSDDRFKQARRSLIDRNRQRQQDQGDSSESDDFHEDEKTLMVNVDELEQGRSSSQGPPPRGSRNRQRGAEGGGSGDFADAATQMVNINELDKGSSGPHGGPQSDSHRTLPSGPHGGPQSGPHGGPQSGPHGGPQSGPHGGRRGGRRVDEQTEPSREALSPSHRGGGSGPQKQVFAPGGGSGHEGKTDFINISEFADEPAQFSPDSGSSGYGGKTEFVHIDAIQGGGPQQGGPAPDDIASDQLLRQSYQFGPQSIQRGEVTLIFAQNPLGKQVVLRQVWSGNPTQAPQEIRQRIGRLDALDHPRLVKLNGVLGTQTGLWADLAKPDGYRLSAVLQQHGPQDSDNVKDWLKQIAEVLDVVHEAGLIYANLTPDAVWIQEDNSVVLEPFDLLSFEHRGDLGPFGPRELKRPPQDRQLSPATDVFSLAAVGAAALTGLPFQPESLAEVEDQKLSKTLQKALVSNPAERPQSAGDLTGQFKGGGLSLSAALGNFDPAEIDIKVVAAMAVLLLGGLAGYMYWNQQQADKASQDKARQEAMAEADPVDEEAGGDDDAAAASDALEEAGAVQMPGSVESDPRLSIHSSFRTNPPEDAKEEVSDEEAVERAAEERKLARRRIDSAKDLASRQDKLDEYKEALANVTTAIRLSGGTPTEDDRELLDELHSQKIVRTYVDELKKRLHTAIDEGSLGQAQFTYKRLAAIDYRADAVDFFDRSSNTEVRLVHQPEDKDEDDK
jgi:hypothetical protein